MSIYNFANWNYSFTPFFGLISDTPFRSFTIERLPNSGGSTGNWFADNLRFGNVPEPASLLLLSGRFARRGIALPPRIAPAKKA